MGFRPCFSNLPADHCELSNGPRIGNISRPGYEVAWDAAGHDFPKGERDDRVVATVDTLPQKRKNCLNKFDRTGAAGCGSPREEIRAFTIDDHNRRARSEPPKSQMSPAVQLQTMQAFGVPLAIDLGIQGRRQRCEAVQPEPNRQQDCMQAARFGDIEGLMTKKHFADNRGPREVLSPRMESASLETVDIDSVTRRRQVQAKSAAEEILPTSACYSMACKVNYGAWRQAPRSHSMDYFEKTLQAERYAKLLGRPNIDSDKEFNRARLVALLEKQQKGGRYARYITDAYSDAAELDSNQSVVSNDQFESDIRGRSISGLSTTASDSSSLSPMSDAQRARIGERIEALNKAGKPGFRKIEGEENIGEDSQEKDNLMPLNLRRVVASLGMPGQDVLSGSMVKEMKYLLGSNAKSTGSSRREENKGTTKAGSRLRAPSRNRGKA